MHGEVATVDNQALEVLVHHLKYNVAEHRTLPPAAFKMPETLHDPRILSKPLNPLSLLGADPAVYKLAVSLHVETHRRLGRSH